LPTSSADSWAGVLILVTHRFSTVAADLVVVIGHGRFSEIGTHAELESRCVGPTRRVRE
jgi:ABC-type multidrug transport system fused ATPase/permease subunit